MLRNPHILRSLPAAVEPDYYLVLSKRMDMKDIKLLNLLLQFSEGRAVTVLIVYLEFNEFFLLSQ